MTPRRGAAAVAALLCAAAVAACGLGPGPVAEGEATITVTQDFGAEPIAEGTVADPPESESVTRALDGIVEIETSYGGNFVDAIDGIAGRVGDGRRSDWFFFVNGYWSPVGAGEARVRPGDRIWWDYRAWEAAYRVPAVVGSWPAPFTGGLDGDAPPTTVACMAAASSCDAAAAALEAEGVAASVERGRADPDPEAPRLLVGSWSRLRRDPAARQIDAGTGRSGVYASFEPAAGSWELALLDERGEPSSRLGPGSALVAAVRRGERAATWVATGTDAAGVRRAVELLDAATLRDRYAVAAGPGGAVLAVPGPGGGSGG